MLINFSNFNLKLIHINSDGTDGDSIPSNSSNWSSANYPGATLTGIFNIPDTFPDGVSRLAVRASRLLTPSGLDTTNQELDIDGDGYSAIPAEDRLTHLELPTDFPIFKPAKALPPTNECGPPDENCQLDPREDLCEDNSQPADD